MTNSTQTWQSRLLYVCATLACAFSTFAFENKPDQIPPDCELITAAGATATSGNAALVIDNNGGTRWESAFNDAESLTVDLGATVNVNSVSIDWEAANAKSYILKGSADNVNWTVISTKTNMPTGARTDIIDSINASYRYLKMEGVLRNLPYGYSIWEFYVCADAIVAPDCSQAVIASATATTGNAALAIDNIAGSRWESAFADPQALTVDLGAVAVVKEVSISWEAANAKDYTLSGSVDGVNWVVIQTLTNMPMGARTDNFDDIDTQYRYLRMDGTARNLTYGYSIFEFDVCVGLDEPEEPVEPLVCNAPIVADLATATTGNGAAAIDGDNGTRWESAVSDPQSLIVDMGEVVTVDFVKIDWETANAKIYTLSGSIDNQNWTLIATKTNMPAFGDHRVDDIVAGGDYRYLKMDGIARNTPYGYSIYEFEVCGQAAAISYIPVPAHIEAEDWYEMNGVQTEATGDTGGGFSVGWIDTNDWMDYAIEVPMTGQYIMNARVAGNVQGGVIEYLLDGVSIGTIPVPNTGGWQVWQTISLNVNLPQGEHIFRIRAASAPFNINWIEIESDFTVWNGTAWNDGTPSGNVNAIINGAYNGNSFDAATLTINAGKTLTITTGNTVTVTGQLINNGGIVVQNNAALVQANGTTYTGVGSFTVHRNSNPLYRLDYTMWSSPVSGQQLKAFSPATLSNRFYTYGYNWDATLSAGAAYVEQYWGVNNTTNFEPGKSYLIRTPNFVEGNSSYDAGNDAEIFNGEFTGIPFNGDVNVPISVSDLNPGGVGTLSLAGHYIGVGNPYASPISVAEFFEQNQGVIAPGNGIYFWRKKNDSSAGSYATLTMAGYTANSAPGGDINEGNGGGAAFYPSAEGTAFNEDWIITAGQGFLVKVDDLANAATDFVKFRNNMRKAAPSGGQQPFFKTMDNGQDTAAASHYWLNITNENNAFAQAGVAYIDGATVGLDYGFDGKLLTNGGTAKLYSVAAQSSLAIQARPAFTNTDVVPMGFAVTVGGEYSISIDRMDGLFTGSQDIYLKDKFTDVLTNLKESNYSFVTEPGTFESRFEVVYMPQSTLGLQAPDLANTVVIYQQDETITINSGAVNMTEVTVYDIRGRKLMHIDNVNAREASFTHLNAAKGVVIIEVNTTAGIISKKIVY